MVGLHVLPPAVLAVLAVGKQTGKRERGFAALKGVEQIRIPQLGSALLIQNGQTSVLVVLKGVNTRSAFSHKCSRLLLSRHF